MSKKNKKLVDSNENETIDQNEELEDNVSEDEDFDDADEQKDQDENENQDETLEEEEEEEEDQEEEEEEEEEKEETVPLKTYLDVKKKYKNLRKKQEALEEKERSQRLKDKRASIMKRWKDAGYDDEAAALFADEQLETYKEIEELKAMRQDSYLDEDVDDLVDEYPEAEKHRAKIKAKIKKYERNGDEISAEEAYLLIAGTKSALRDKKVRDEQTKRIKNTNKKKGSNVKTSSGGTPKDVYQLDKYDLKALKRLQKAQPDAGWNRKKYFEMMKK